MTTERTPRLRTGYALRRDASSLHRETIEVASVVEQAIESVEPLIRQRVHQVRVKVAGGALHVWADRTRLVQCLGNLLNNAATYTDGGGHIDIEVRDAAGRVSIRISDDGVGISPELRRGATFELSLPLAAAPPQQTAPPDRRRCAGKRVLVVDDNVDAADSLALILNHEGHETTTVYSSADALKEAFTDLAPHVILLDIGLPGMDGYEVARRLRSGGSTAQLIALTGYGRGEDVERARAEGFDMHMVKPIDIPALLRQLATA